METITYVYDGTFKGLMSLLYDVYTGKAKPLQNIIKTEEESMQESLFEEKASVTTDNAKEKEFCRIIKRKISGDCLDRIRMAFLTEKENIEMEIYRYLEFGFEKGKVVDKYLSDDRVVAIHSAAAKAGGEAHRLKGFIRFEEIGNGFLYGRVEPDYNIIHFLAGYFRKRLAAEKWVIHDAKRGIAVFYDKRKCELREIETSGMPPITPGEKQFKKMWQDYFETIAIRERLNPKLQRQFVPKKYRKNMVEFKKG
jgi:probable DNA metabolism protein